MAFNLLRRIASALLGRRRVPGAGAENPETQVVGVNCEYHNGVYLGSTVYCEHERTPLETPFRPSFTPLRAEAEAAWSRDLASLAKAVGSAAPERELAPDTRTGH